MSTAAHSAARVIPAHLDFLAIYNPELGRHEETENDQIVFYYSSKTELGRQKEDDDAPDTRDEDARKELDEQMRQVGLAQGVINFAKSFSDGADVDSVETQKHRIVLTELETGWWILASICLTVLPRQATGVTAMEPQGTSSIEYSSREVTPPQLLLQQLQRAHRIFLLHHSPTLNDHYNRLPRGKSTKLLENFWKPFARNWDVLLHGNPAVDAYDGIKLAAGGELGVGVGEEEWGSGEREVLEDLVRNTDGLVDIIVSRFGDAPQSTSQKMQAASTNTRASEVANGDGWLGCMPHTAPSDGMLFSGCGTMHPQSLLNLTAWMETIYTYGQNAYGVRENPTADRRKRRRRPSPKELPPMPEPEEDDGAQPQVAEAASEHYPDIPRPIITAAEEALENATKSAETHIEETPKDDANKESDGWMGYLTLGYNTKWFGGAKDDSKPGSKPATTSKAKTTTQIKKAYPPSTTSSIRSTLLPDADRPASKQTQPPKSSGRFLIGLHGDLDRKPVDLDDSSQLEEGNRISLRTVHLNMARPYDEDDDDSGVSESSTSPHIMSNRKPKWERLRLVVYILQPFIFTLLFEPTTDSLSMPTFFLSLHRHLQALHKPLLNSTSPTNVALRLASVLSPHNQSSPTSTSPTTPTTPSTPATPTSPPSSPIFSLIYHPQTLTISSSLPNIPLPGTLAAEGFPTGPSSASPFSTPPWTRVEALNVHAQIMASWAAGRQRHGAGAREQSAKTSRGWWVCWMRLEVSEEPAVENGDGDGDGDRNEHVDRDEGGGEGKGMTTQRPRIPTMTSYETQQRAQYREAILIRRAGGGPMSGSAVRSAESSGAGTFAAGIGIGAGGAISRWTGGLLGGDSGGRAGGGGGGASGSGSAGQDRSEAGAATFGLGVDARRYVESLLSLNR